MTSKCQLMERKEKKERKKERESCVRSDYIYIYMYGEKKN